MSDAACSGAQTARDVRRISRMQFVVRGVAGALTWTRSTTSPSFSMAKSTMSGSLPKPRVDREVGSISSATFAGSCHRLAGSAGSALDVSVFAATLSYQYERRVPILTPASALVHIAAAPNRVRSWVGASEWMPDLAGDATPADVLAELRGRPATVSARCGYLLQGHRPDIAAGQGPVDRTRVESVVDVTCLWTVDP
jgi:hypothetical protein